MFLPLMEFAFGIMIMSVIFTQIVIPFFRGTPIFPALQKHGIEAKIETARQEIRIAKLERQLVDLQNQADKIRQKQGEE